MGVDTSVVALHSAKDGFSVALRILSNVGSLVPNKNIDPKEEYGAVVVKLSEGHDFLGLGEFIEFHKLLLDITPREDGTYAVCTTLCFPLLDPEVDEIPDDEDEVPPDYLKLYSTLPAGEAVDNFLKMVSAKKFYYAIFSTPAYDGRVVIKHKTGVIAAKAYEERLYKVQ